MVRRFLVSACLLAGLLGYTPRVWAQGCALCYASVAAAGTAAQEALRSGILALLIPVLLLLVGVALLIWRRSTPSATP
jgi:hypothetical protein